MIPAETCRKIREAFQLDAAGMARLIGKHMRTWYRYEKSGCDDPSVEILITIMLRHADVRLAEVDRANTKGESPISTTAKA